MAFEIALHTRMSPADTLERIRQHAAYWQESQVPPALRTAGALGVDAEIRGDKFTLFVQSLGRRPAPTDAQLTGRVHATDEGGALVRARVGVPRTYAWWYVVLGAVSLDALWTHSWPAFGALAGMMALSFGRDYLIDRGISR